MTKMNGMQKALAVLLPLLTTAPAPVLAGDWLDDMMNEAEDLDRQRHGLLPCEDVPRCVAERKARMDRAAEQRAAAAKKEAAEEAAAAKKEAAAEAAAAKQKKAQDEAAHALGRPPRTITIGDEPATSSCNGASRRGSTP
jgi:membrane protein involved in colicin uptake